MKKKRKTKNEREASIAKEKAELDSDKANTSAKEAERATEKAKE